MLGYAIYMSTDAGVSFNLVDEEHVANKPYLNEYTITGLTLVGQEH